MGGGRRRRAGQAPRAGSCRRARSRGNRRIVALPGATVRWRAGQIVGRGGGLPLKVAERDSRFAWIAGTGAVRGRPRFDRPGLSARSRGRRGVVVRRGRRAGAGEETGCHPVAVAALDVEDVVDRGRTEPAGRAAGRRRTSPGTPGGRRCSRAQVTQRRTRAARAPAPRRRAEPGLDPLCAVASGAVDDGALASLTAGSPTS